MPLPPHYLRLLLALAASFAFHAFILSVAGRTWTSPQRPPAQASTPLQAQLQAPEKSAQQPPGEALLKDTLADEERKTQSAVPSVEPALQGRHPTPPRSRTTPAARERAAQRKLAEHLFYPPEAVARGLEGEVRLLLVLDPSGRVLQAQVASSSGHALLDQAAVKAAYAMQRLPVADAREMILPVVFRLQ